MKLTENISKLKELWKSLKSLGLKFERSILILIVLKMINPLILMLNIQPEILVLIFRIWLKIQSANFPIQISQISQYGVLSLAQCYSHLGLTKQFHLLPTEKVIYLRFLEIPTPQKQLTLTGFLEDFYKMVSMFKVYDQLV